jgi:hypothetical protein
LDTLYDPTTLNALRITLLKRSKKRLRDRRQHVLHHETVRESHTRRQHLHQNIDTWLKNMQHVVEEAKRVSLGGSVICKHDSCSVPHFPSCPIAWLSIVRKMPK